MSIGHEGFELRANGVRIDAGDHNAHIFFFQFKEPPLKTTLDRTPVCCYRNLEVVLAAVEDSPRFDVLEESRVHHWFSEWFSDVYPHLRRLNIQSYELPQALAAVIQDPTRVAPKLTSLVFRPDLLFRGTLRAVTQFSELEVLHLSAKFMPSDLFGMGPPGGRLRRLREFDVVGRFWPKLRSWCPTDVETLAFDDRLEHIHTNHDCLKATRSNNEWLDASFDSDLRRTMLYGSNDCTERYARSLHAPLRERTNIGVLDNAIPSLRPRNLRIRQLCAPDYGRSHLVDCCTKHGVDVSRVESLYLEYDLHVRTSSPTIHPSSLAPFRRLSHLVVTRNRPHDVLNQRRGADGTDLDRASVVAIVRGMLRALHAPALSGHGIMRVVLGMGVKPVKRTSAYDPLAGRTDSELVALGRDLAIALVRRDVPEGGFPTSVRRWMYARHDWEDWLAEVMVDYPGWAVVVYNTPEDGPHRRDWPGWRMSDLDRERLLGNPPGVEHQPPLPKYYSTPSVLEVTEPANFTRPARSSALDSWTLWMDGMRKAREGRWRDTWRGPVVPDDDGYY